MKAFRIGCIIGVWVFALSVAQSFSQEEMRVVDNAVFERPARVPCVFDHDKHNATAGLEDCAVCHHLYKDGELIADESSEDQACSACHLTDGSGSNPSLRRAFHLNCKQCHLREGAGPIMCAQCHQATTPFEASAE